MTIEKKYEWRDYYEYPGLQVRRDGEVIRYIEKNNLGIQKRPPRYYTIKKESSGRRYINIKPNGQNQKLYVDVMVATCFCYRAPGPYVAHKDGNIYNDCSYNLEWVDATTYRNKYHPERKIKHNGEDFIWWQRNIYISETGKLLIEGILYNSIHTSFYDSDLDLKRAVPAYIHYDSKRVFIEDGIKEVWNKVILHIDGDFGNWQDSNLKLVDINSPEACQRDESWKIWRLKEDRRFYEERDKKPMPQFLE